METETKTLKIKAERLGTVKEVKQLLTDFEDAYNSIYAFVFLVDTLSSDNERRRDLLKENFRYWEKHWGKYFPEPFIFEFLNNRHLYENDTRQTNLLELQSKIDIDKIVLPADRLIISKVNIQSPGFWEFLCSANPLTFIREFIKDLTYRNRQEKELGELKILQEKISTLKQLGYNDIEIRQMTTAMVTEPLKKIERHKDSGLIDGLEE